MPKRPRYEDQIVHPHGYSPTASVSIEDVPEGIFPAPNASPPEPPAAPETSDN